MTVDVQPWLLPSINANVSANRPRPDATRPRTSGRCSRDVSFDSWMNRKLAATATAPTGTLM
jgi:hypothetical protein